ncbi:MBL fold metallo-hydrolase [Erythrobacter sp. GH1-10]|uniref:MBL fold metallo-hydrolase n=1 Tax=Erythrobacter sp. GH1-10 TaxID=3349334 RepID=UPI00387831FC
MIKKLGIGFAAVLVLITAAFLLFQVEIGRAVFERAVATNATRNLTDGLPDGLHIGLCGTGSPMPNPERAGPCNIVIAGGQMFVVDIGEGGNRNIAQMGFNAADIDAVFLTHFHSDHIDGLGPLQLFHWTRGASKAPLSVYGPTGVETVVEGFNRAYEIDYTYRIAHHGEEVVPSTGGGSIARPFVMEAPTMVVVEKDGVKITAFTVDHSPVEPALGYRFDYKGRSLCISGDTVRSTNLETACEGVDLLVHEALQPALVGEVERAFASIGNANAAKIMADIVDYHASPEDAADSAKVAGAKMLVLSHLVPPLPSTALYPAFLGDAENRFDGELVMGEDGMLFSLPAGSEKIERDELM